MSDQRFLVSARKHRPKQFRELVAQEHVARTLQNALRMNKLAHAYLFSGPRGVGKTTAARILAKAINCTTGEPEPCRMCGSCEDFEQGRSMSIFEIDAASNNKVEDIRDLQDTVQVPPQNARRKVYIVDEVHMLSKAAFNALLKTLEEPPPHVLFIFATTEPHKVLPTILSRCQRFDFRRIPVEDIFEHLKGICTAENIEADEDSLLLLARKGDGALRDALSAFDQAVALCGTRLQYADLADALGVVDVERFFEATDNVADRNRAGMLHLADSLVRGGRDIQEFLGGLAEHLRNLLVAQSLQDPAFIPASDAVRERYMRAANEFTEPTLLRLLMAVDEAQRSITSTANAQLRLELTLLRMASMQDSLVLTEAIKQVDELIRMARRGRLAAPDVRPPPSRTPAKPRRQRPRAPKRSESSQRRRTDEHPQRKPQPPQEEVRSRRRHRTDQTVAKEELLQPAAPPEPSGTPRSAASEPPGRQKAPRAPVPGAAGDPLDHLRAGWKRLAEKAKSRNRKVLGSYLETARPLRLQDGTLHIGVADSLQESNLKEAEPTLLRELERLGSSAPQRLVFEVLEELQEHIADRPVDPARRLRERARNEPVVKALIKQLDLRVA